MEQRQSQYKTYVMRNDLAAPQEVKYSIVTVVKGFFRFEFDCVPISYVIIALHAAFLRRFTIHHLSGSSSRFWQLLKKCPSNTRGDVNLIDFLVVIYWSWSTHNTLVDRELVQFDTSLTLSSCAQLDLRCLHKNCVWIVITSPIEVSWQKKLEPTKATVTLW